LKAEIVEAVSLRALEILHGMSDSRFDQSLL
jgi:hypothetical protein